MAHDKNIPVIMDAETEVMSFPGFPQIIENAEYVKCGETFPQRFTKQEDKLVAMNIIMETGALKKLVVITLGSLGSVALIRSEYQSNAQDISDFEQLHSTLKNETSETNKTFNYKPKSTSCPPSILIYCPAYKHVEISDPTGAGDVHLGALVYGISQKLPINKMLRLSAVVASMKCRFSGTKGIPKLAELDMDWINNI